MTQAMILAAGLGTRLAPLTWELPKPLMPVGDRSLVAHLASRLAIAGFPDFVMNIHHMPEKFVFRSGELESTPHLIHEEEVRGTAGGIRGARALFGDAPVLVWNGDILVEPPIPGLLAAASAGGLAFAVSAMARGEGTMGLGENGSVVRLRGETFGHEVAGADYVGVAALGASVVQVLPEWGCLIGDVALPMLRAGKDIQTAQVAGPWIDVGSLHSYQRANREWLSAKVGGGGSWVAPTASVSGDVVLAASVVGAGASVSGTGAFDRCVVWPGAHAVAPLADAIVTTSGRVVAVK
jgi:mannose-1-phosphate guanylyltransferase